MKRLISIVAVIGLAVCARADFAFSTNDAFNVPNFKATSNVFAVSKAGNARVGGTLTVDGATTFSGNIVTSGSQTNAGNVTVNGSQTVTNSLTVGSTASVGGILTLGGTTTVFTAAATVNTNAAVPLQGIAVRVNGTNYVIKLYPITGP